MKILIVEDDAGLCRGISFALSQAGYETASAENKKGGWELFLKEHPDAVILDLNLPDGDGIGLCSLIRTKSEVPVLMLTARDMEVDEIMGLKSGADDYITKPFSISVLKIRLEKALQKYIKQDSGKMPEPELSSEGICLNPNTARAYLDGKELDLSLTEFRLLKYLLENKNQILLKEQILQHIWDDSDNFVEENTLSVNISRLRKKTGTNSIKTIYGMGYLWEE
ncbi:MAG TPA: DNA-binding response regulator [Lachnospiraceae bacterium]|nr:DNA-binding response regulator [Lachnospiraceae bacterium]